MSWTDKASIEVIKKIRDKFKVKTFIETGTFMGINARVHSANFDKVMTCEKEGKYVKMAIGKLNEYDNVSIFWMNSPEFLKETKNVKMPIIYLDAHFYDK